MARISLDEQLAKAQRRLEQLKAQKEQREQRELAADRARQRKLETRQKIVLGGQLLKLVASGDADATGIYERMLSQLSERDQKIFGDVDDPTANDLSAKHDELVAQYLTAPIGGDVPAWTAYVRNHADLALRIDGLGEGAWADAAAQRFREAVKQWEAATGRQFSLELVADLQDAA